MRIMMVTYEYPPYLIGGLGTHCQQFARGLAKRGHEVSVLSYCLDREWTYNDEGVAVRYLQFPWPNRRHLYDGSVEEISALEDQVRALSEEWLALIDPDLIHVHEWIAYMVARPLVSRLHKPLIITMHGLTAEQRRRWGGSEETRKAERLENLSCHGADKIIAVSGAVKAWIVENFHIDAARVAVVHNGSAFPSTVQSTRTNEDPMWRALQRGGKKLIVFAGRLVRTKGVDALLASAPTVLDKHPEACYVIAGDTEPSTYLEELRRLRATHSLNSRVCFLGKLTAAELADLYRHATVAAVPSIYEPFGYAATEAMASRVPVVASDVDGLSEIIDDETTGLLVPLDRDYSQLDGSTFSERFATALCRILEDPPLAKRLADSGKSKAETCFGVDPMLDRTISIYSNLLASSHSSSTMPDYMQETSEGMSRPQQRH